MRRARASKRAACGLSWMGFYLDLQRRLGGIARLYGDQALTREEALHSFTLAAAYAAHQEERLGSLEPGKFADMAILAEDPLEVDPMRLRDIEVLGTMSGGVIHKANK